jgi:hypothetical protein
MLRFPKVLFSIIGSVTGCLQRGFFLILLRSYKQIKGKWFKSSKSGSSNFSYPMLINNTTIQRYLVWVTDRFVK